MNYLAFIAVAALCVAGCGKKADQTVAVANAATAANATAPAPVADTGNATSVAPQDSDGPIKLATDGIKLGGDTVGFGTSQDDTVQFLTPALGAPTGSDTNSDCDGGPLGSVKFKGGLELLFKAGNFVGWQIDGDSNLVGANGIALGMRYTDVNKLARDVEGEDSSLGHEFTADDYHGLLTDGGPDGKVTTLWAGTICANR